MKTTELNAAGTYNAWELEVLKELQLGNFTNKVGKELLLESATVNIWMISILPNESLPFHKHTYNYNWTAMTSGTATSHYENGRIIAIKYEKGDAQYYDHDIHGDFVHNLTNTGTEPLDFFTIEMKN